MTTSTTPHATTYDQLLDRIITDGIAEVSVAYADPKEHHKRDGAIEGFEACRGKTPADLIALWVEAERDSMHLRREPSAENVQAYWKQRYNAIQIEFVLNVLSVGLETPLLAHLPTSRGAMKYAEIMGVRGEGANA